MLPTPTASLSLNTGAVRTMWILLTSLRGTTLYHPGSRLSAGDISHKPWERFPQNTSLICSCKARAGARPTCWTSPFYLGQELGLKNPSGLQPL